MLFGIKIQDLPTGTVAQWVKHRRFKPWTWVQILANVFFCFSSVAIFLSLLPLRSVGGSNFDWELQKLNNVDSNNDIQILKITILRILSTVDNSWKNTVDKNKSIKVHMKEGERRNELKMFSEC